MDQHGRKTSDITAAKPSTREGSREPQHWAKRAKMEKDMPHECTKIAEEWHKHALNLTGASFHKQTRDKNKALKNTFPPGNLCSIDILGVLVRSKLSYTNKGQKEALKHTFLTLVGPHCLIVFTVFYAHCTSKPSNAG